MRGWRVPGSRRLLPLALSAGLAFAALTQAEQTLAQGRRDLGRPGEGPAVVVPGEILVKYRADASAEDVAESHRRHGGVDDGEIGPLRVKKVKVKPGQEREQAARYKGDRIVEFSEPNGTYYALGAPNDPRFPQQWQYTQPSDADIDAVEAWDRTLGSTAVAIAILDSGIDTTHEDLKAKVVKSINFSRARNADDRLGHGTHVAGIAAAVSNNGLGVAGTCQRCVLYNVKVLGDDGAGAWDGIARGIIWAADNGAKVINMSFGAYAESLTVRDAVAYAWGKGVVLTAAAGNDGQNWGFYPGVFEQTIAVAATTSSDARWASSNHGGNWVDLAAPGADILSTAPDHASSYWPSAPKYGSLSGTSMAAPHVAGVAGLVWSTALCPARNSTCVRSRLETTADPIGRPAYDATSQWRYGRLNACRAVGGSCQIKAQ